MIGWAFLFNNAVSVVLACQTLSMCTEKRDHVLLRPIAVVQTKGRMAIARIFRKPYLGAQGRDMLLFERRSTAVLFHLRLICGPNKNELVVAHPFFYIKVRRPSLAR